MQLLAAPKLQLERNAACAGDTLPVQPEEEETPNGRTTRFWKAVRNFVQ
jgi:hypothetical protein